MAVHAAPTLFEDEKEESSVKVFEGGIPMVDSYKPSKGEFSNDTDRYKADLDSLPDALSVDEMKGIDVESFARAMLKGMTRRDGSTWKEGTGLATGGGGMVEAMVAVPKAKGAGLGSEASNTFERNKKLEKGQTHRGMLVAAGDKPRNYVGVSEKLIKKKTIEPTAKVIITAGPHTDHPAIVTVMPSTDAALRKDDKITVQLLSSGTTLVLPYGALRLYTHTDADREAAKKRPLEDISQHQHHQPAKRKKRPTTPLTWVIQPGIIVRYIQDGPHYNKKYPVLDVTSRTDFTLKTAEGVLEQVSEDEVETVIPRDPGARVLVLAGRKKGQEAELMKRNKSKEEVIVRFAGSLTKTYTFGYSEVCAI